MDGSPHDGTTSKINLICLTLAISEIFTDELNKFFKKSKLECGSTDVFCHRNGGGLPSWYKKKLVLQHIKSSNLLLETLQRYISHTFPNSQFWPKHHSLWRPMSPEVVMTSYLVLHERSREDKNKIIFFKKA